MELENIVFNFSDQLQSIYKTFALEAKIKNIEIVYEENTPVGYVKGDPNKLSQIIINLLSNAMKFTLAGGVKLSASAHPGDASGFQKIIIEVADSGIGIAQEKIDTIFQAFVQADNSVTRKFGGTGLGLAISKRLVEMMGGAISVKSELGKGTVFSITIALETVATPIVDINQPSYTMPIYDKDFILSILVVEDDAINQKLIRRILENKGHILKIVSNGKEAVDLLASESGFDIILMDVHMPILSGREASKIIKADTELSRIPIIALTASSMKEDIDLCYAAGMDDFLEKPIDMDNLDRVLRKWYCLKNQDICSGAKQASKS
jgi:CheY-like chemotaxis protein